MSALEQITQMQAQGMSDQDIANNLQEQGISPAEIDQAFNQAQVKNAVTGEQPQEIPQEQMPQDFSQAPQEFSQQMPQDFSQAPAPGMTQEYYPQQNYDPYATSTGDTSIEIAGQVFTEKIQPLTNKLNEINEFKNLTQVQIQHLENRLKKIEEIISRIETAVLNKIGSYGKNLDNIKKELAMTQSLVKKKRTSKTSKK